MFEVLASDRFEEWFAALSEAEAEEVSLAIDVAAELAPALDPVRARRALLWFDGGPLPGGAFVRARHGLELAQLKELVLTGLESEEFRRRLGGLEGRAASEALAAVERVQRLLTGRRWLEALGGMAEHSAIALDPAEAWLLELIGSERASERARVRAGMARAAARQPLPARPLPDPVYLALLESLRQVGLGPRSLEPTESGLCELGVEARGAALRIIYGMDLPRSRLIAIAGDRLDRRYYGDSVRFAERYFRDYLARGDDLSAELEGPPPR
jgi:hypothetical protein